MSSKSGHQPLIGIVLCFGLGIGAEQFLFLDYSLISVLSGVLIILILIMRSNRWTSVCISILFILLGGMTVNSAQEKSRDNIYHSLRYSKGKLISLKGLVISAVKKKTFKGRIKSSFTFDVHQEKAPWGWRKRTGKVLVNLYRDGGIHYGDKIQLEGRLHYPFNFGDDKKFSYRQYLNNRRIYAIFSVKKEAEVVVLEKDQGHYFIRRSLYFRERLKSIFRENLSAKEAGLMQAILLGDRTFIAPYIRELFVSTGTAHVLAISGLHIGVVAGLFLMLFKILPVGRNNQHLGTILLLIGFAFLTGGRASVIRATIMSVIFLASSIFEKEPKGLNTLSGAALILLLWNPMYLFDVGFQLSFLCVCSIILLRGGIYEILLKVFSCSPHFLIKIFLQSLSVSTAVWFGILGLIAYYFNIITPITVGANLIIVPMLTIILILGVGLLLVELAVPGLSAFFVICLKVALNTMVAVIYVLDKIPGSSFPLRDITCWHVIGYYSFLSAIIAMIKIRGLFFSFFLNLNPAKFFGKKLFKIFLND